jgi:hypothetical protein
MSEPAKSDFAVRLRKLPGQLLLALVNGTAVLVIVAAVLAMIASSKVMHLAQNVASTMTDAVFSKVSEDPRQLVQTIQGVSDDIHTLTVALAKAKADGVTGLNPEVTRLNERLDLLETNLKRLLGARSDLIEGLIAKVGNAVGDALQNFRACPQRDAKAWNSTMG